MSDSSTQVFFNILCWGIVVASSSAAKDFAGLLTARFLLGIFEASIGVYSSFPLEICYRNRTINSAFVHCNNSNVVAP